MLLKSKKLNGFTFVELLVVIAISATLSVLAIANFRDRGIKTNIETQAQKFASILEQAQMMALTGEKTIGGSRPFGYGVFINLDDYYLFADMDGDNIRDAGDRDIQHIVLPSPVVVDNHQTYIIFYPPKAKIYINPSILTPDKVISFSSPSSSNISLITLYIDTGKIKIDNN